MTNREIYLLLLKCEELENPINELKELKSEFFKKSERMLSKTLILNDLLFVSCASKLIDIINPFINSHFESNLTTCAILTRVAIEVCLACFAGTLVDDADDFVLKCVLGDQELSNYPHKNKLSSRFLCKKFDEIIHINIYDLYKKCCRYVHFSSRSLLDNAKILDNSKIEFSIGITDGNMQEKARLCNELARLFYTMLKCFSGILFESYIKQKEEEGL